MTKVWIERGQLLKYVGRVVMRYPQAQMQEDTRRSRRIAKSRELFEQQ